MSRRRVVARRGGEVTAAAWAQSVRLSRYGIFHVSSGDSKERPNDAMRLNWGLGTPLPALADL